MDLLQWCITLKGLGSMGIRFIYLFFYTVLLEMRPKLN